MEQKTINVIGDIHGRTNWKDLVDENCTNVFVGDYFDPYTNISNSDLEENFLEIIDFKQKHPDTILLLGNHDHHYIVPAYGGSTSRYNRTMANRFKEMFDEFSDMFYGIAYAPDHAHVVTHAGVTRDWFYRYFESDDFSGIYSDDGRKVPTTIELERLLNNLWNRPAEEGNVEKSEFAFGSNCDFWDTYGDTPTQSPIWIRPDSLANHNLYDKTGIVQIVGHTQVRKVEDLSDQYGLVLVDCLGSTTESFKLTIDSI